MKAVPVKKLHICRILGKLSVKSESLQVWAKNLYEKPVRRTCTKNLYEEPVRRKNLYEKLVPGKKESDPPEGRRLTPFVRHLPLDGRMVRIE